MRRARVSNDPASMLTTAVFVVTFGLVVGTVMSIGPVNSLRRIREGIDNAIGFVNDVTKPRPIGLT